MYRNSARKHLDLSVRGGVLVLLGDHWHFSLVEASGECTPRQVADVYLQMEVQIPEKPQQLSEV